MQLSAETRLKAILEGTGAGTWEFNLDTGEIIFNDRWASMLGYTLDELSPVSFQTWERLCHADDVQAAHQALARYLNGEDPLYECVVRMMHRSGEWRYIHTRGTLLTDHDDLGGRWLMGTHLDVTDEKVSQHQLQKLAESLPGVIYTFVMEPDGSFHFPYLSQKTEDFYGVSAEDARANPNLMFDPIHPDDLPRLQASIGESAQTLCQWVCDFRIVQGDRIRWLRGVSRPERDIDGSITWHGVITDIDDRKLLELELEQLSITDELTGLYNRRYMLRKLEELAAETERYGHTFSLVSLDIDFFKAINDSWGHPMGDSVLQTIAQLIESRTRKADIVARTGGEEFIVLMPNTTLGDARHVAEALRTGMESLAFVSDEGESFSVTLSAGVVSWSTNVPSVRDLLAMCDQSLYQAKRAGRNRVVVSGAEDK
ncbi:diguanylate cyclase [Marinobacter sp. M216]|uniref:diguanylate cyclase n=1 Tax=Marinobacter albus TaxID=3030833 RepID=A0ABT7HDA5_9GAMM|nr:MULTISPECIES: sensor domain-containing diguanylate cyclase [unclassified Marinobacter]MBW7471772.1 diguanylate cyclase [Marinobacter sp. F4218]MDK9558341.1 diguanylate cyclase [Marinobacter sp. M216]